MRNGRISLRITLFLTFQRVHQIIDLSLSGLRSLTGYIYENIHFDFLRPGSLIKIFDNFVASNWKSTSPYLHAAQEFTKNVSDWNYNIFGNIFQQKRRLLARIGGVQKVLERHEA